MVTWVFVTELFVIEYANQHQKIHLTLKAGKELEGFLYPIRLKTLEGTKNEANNGNKDEIYVI